MAKAHRKAGRAVFQLKVTLKHLEPAIWRRLLVPADVPLSQLHLVLNESMGWACLHLHSFAIGDRTFGDPRANVDHGLGFEDERKSKLDSLAGEGQSLRYYYDFGDGWEHEVVVEARFDADERLVYPLCIDGGRACPPEDCGGVPGYQHLVQAIRNPSDAEHDDLLTWVGGHFDPEGFDVNRTNRALRALPGRR